MILFIPRSRLDMPWGHRSAAPGVNRVKNETQDKEDPKNLLDFHSSLSYIVHLNYFEKNNAVSVQLVILGLLAEKPRHGYELRQEVERRLYATYINLSGGSLYYNLGQLERSGHVEKAWAEQKGRYPTRQVYQITPAGTEYLQAEVRRLLFDTEARDKLFDPLNAALAFGYTMDSSELREALTTQLTWARQRAAWVTEQKAYWRTQERISLTHAKIIEHGLAHLQAEIGWLEQFLQDLDAQETPQLKSVSRPHVS
jgi:DNA-binding PadR family transcriptional regulator